MPIVKHENESCCRASEAAMRIISGTHKGRRIDAPKKLGIRPTTDFAKESLFNILINNFDFSELTVLDLFSGSGAISFEFASRGSEKIILVEKDFSRMEFIKTRSRDFGFSTIRTVKTDVFRYLENCSETFSIIFADPPFEIKGLDTILKIVVEKKLLMPGGWLIIEHSSDHDFSNAEQFLQKRVYGSVNFSIFKA